MTGSSHRLESNSKEVGWELADQLAYSIHFVRQSKTYAGLSGLSPLFLHSYYDRRVTVLR